MLELSPEEVRESVMKGLAETTSEAVADASQSDIRYIITGFQDFFLDVETVEEARLVLEKVGRNLGEFLRRHGADVVWETSPDVTRKYAEKMAEQTGLPIEEVRKSTTFQQYAKRMSEGGK